MNDLTIEVLGTIFFAIAVVHTFLAPRLLKWSHHFKSGSASEAFLHLMGEIEVVFGFWAAIFMAIFATLRGAGTAVAYHESLHFTEPIFVFCIMVVAATRPVMFAARALIQMLGHGLSKILRIPEVVADLFVILTLGPLSGSFITEPAAMTVTTLLLRSMIKKSEDRWMYFLLGVLFVNISIGGALTSFAAPPILMVAGKWSWSTSYVFTHFGWKSAIAVLVNTLVLILVFRKRFQENMQSVRVSAREVESIPLWIVLVHYLIVLALVLTAHHESAAMGVFMLFLGIASVTKQYQDALRLKESLLVAFFLAGIIMFGNFQSWWLSPLLSGMDQITLYLGATSLTAVTDNAALTYLGSQVEGLTEISKYYLVAGAIAGGGLTIIANAPNAAGFSILQKNFSEGFSPLLLLRAAIIPTVIAVICLGIFQTL
ncbi:MAG: hypothetical protein COT73_08340 [Bdellovibrio sp. CG10_big_fil_rev_8_21_14_0_10_47_8]|nr:MAG: hypothetical protein COT73_08340 [Bdellovibrio sp. CG10_big_fil_rev_8_21_14_0_10_47_8]